MHIVIDNRIRQSSTGRYSDRLVEHLQNIDKQNRYSILLQPDDKWKPSSNNFKVVYAPYSQFSFSPFDQIGFSKLLYSLKADLVHFPMNQQPLFYLKPTITSTLDTTMLNYTRPGSTPLPVFWLKMLGYRLIFWYSNKKSKAIITITKYVRNDLAKKYPFTLGKTTTTYCASEPTIAKKASKPKNSPKKFILYVGTAFPHKNLDRLIEAHELLIKKHPDLFLVLVGKKEFHYEQLLKRAEASIARSRIIITGFVSDSELRWYYENAECYVFPSLSEGFGLTGLEAMAHGCALASSNATCLPEVYEDAAHYFNPEDPKDIASKVGDIIDDPDLRKSLVSRGYKQVKKYSWETMAKQTLAVYNKVLSS